MSEEEFINLGVGQRFELNDKTYEVKEPGNGDEFSCEGCAFYYDDDCRELDIPECYGISRKDKKAVIFAELEED